MKKFAIKFPLFILMILACDYSVGYALKYMYARTVSGDVGTVNAILRQRNEILIMGSSRAKYHYDPAVLSKAFNRGVYNAGMEGQGALCQYGLLNLIIGEYRPEAILLNVDPADLLEERGVFDKLNVLLPHSGNPAVLGIVSRRSRYEKLKLTSKIYPYNSLILSLIACQFLPLYGTTPDGYEPVHGTLTEEAVQSALSNGNSAGPEESPEHLAAGTEILDSICDLTRKNGIKLIAGISPSWIHGVNGEATGVTSSSIAAQRNKANAFLAEYFSKKGVPVIRITQDIDGEFIDYSLFNDTYHLNEKGASLFSMKVASNLQPLLNPAIKGSEEPHSNISRASFDPSVTEEPLPE